MLKEDVEIGQKVLPHSKTIWSELEDSFTWRVALKRNQNYLFVTIWDEDENAFVLSEDKDDLEGGDFFSPNDFEPYIENEMDELIKALKNIGICVKNSDGTFRSFTDVMDELSDAWDKLERE